MNTIKFSKSNPNRIDSRKIFEINKWFAYIHEGYAKHPCTRLACVHGFAVGRVSPYRCIGRTESPFIQLKHSHGVSVNPLDTDMKHLITGCIS